jgi:hypothetical protein
MKIQRKKRSLVATLFLAAVLGTSAYAFTADVGGIAATAGDGHGDITGFNASAISFTAGDYGSDTTVTFTLDAPATDVQAGSTDLAADLVPCSNTGGNDWSCTLTGTSLHSADHLRIVAVDAS